MIAAVDLNEDGVINYEELNRTGMLHSFRRYLDYPAFIQKMYETVAQSQNSDQRPTGSKESTMSGSAQKRLAELDSQLAQLDYQRNQLLAERRRLIGCEVDNATTGALKQQLEMVQYREDVGND